MTAQMTPKMAAISMSACADRWLRGFSSKMSTWLTPAERQPCTLMPIRKMNRVMWNGPRNRRTTVSHSWPSAWNTAVTWKRDPAQSEVSEHVARCQVDRRPRSVRSQCTGGGSHSLSKRRLRAKPRQITAAQTPPTPPPFRQRQ